jgi:Tol biopolymer transport system component
MGSMKNWLASALGVALLACSGLTPQAAATHEDRALYVHREADGSRFSLMSVRLDGSDAREILHQTRYELDPCWSPDGGQVAVALVTAPKAAHTELWVVSADGTERRKIHEVDGGMFGASWSPDGKHLAFNTLSSRAGDDAIALYVADPSGKKVVCASRTTAAWPAWTPDSKRLYVTTFPEATASSQGQPVLASVAPDGADPQAVLGKNTMLGVMSPDGKYLAYCDQTDEGPSNIFRCDADGHNVVQLTHGDPQHEHYVLDRWAQDGHSLLYTHETATQPQAQCEVWRMDFDGGNPRRLTPAGEQNFTRAAFLFLPSP